MESPVVAAFLMPLVVSLYMWIRGKIVNRKRPDRYVSATVIPDLTFPPATDDLDGQGIKLLTHDRPGSNTGSGAHPG